MSLARFLLNLSVILLVIARAEGQAFEWAGIFETPQNQYRWNAQKVGGVYADPAMKLVALPAPNATAEALHALEPEGLHAMGMSCVNVNSNGVIVPEDDKCYQLSFDSSLSTTTFDVNSTGVDYIAFFTEHVPTEFEVDTHYFQDQNGSDVEPQAQINEAGDHDHDHHDHGHEDHAFEWAGIFETPQDQYAWLAQKVDGSYADPTMILVALPASSATEEALHALEGAGEAAMEMTCQQVNANDEIVPMVDTCYTLHFDDDVPTTIFKVSSANVDNVAFFAQHVPTEFESDTHYFKDSAGEDVEPQAEINSHGEEEDDDKPWGDAIGAAIVVNAVTLIGVIFTVPFMREFSNMHRDAFFACILSFAAGAILACAFFLLLFEGVHLVGVDWKDETDATWRWGTAILAGFMLPMTIQTATSMAVQAQEQQTPNAPEQEGDKQGDGQQLVRYDPVTRARVLAGVLIGDFFHNLCDGFFMGAGFSGCGVSFGWSVTGSTVAHELAQEIADYMILVSPEVGFHPILALVTNFVSGLGVLLGVVIILSSDVSDGATGLLLAFGGGVYIHIAATDCMPYAYNKNLSLATRIGVWFAFVLGTIAIGLVLLDHEHCIPEGETHAHGGH